MSELVVIDNQKVALPEARHDLAAKVRPHIPRVIRMLPTDADRIQFATAIMVACNEVDPDKVNPGKETTLLSAALGAVRMNLMPGAELGLCYFVPFKGAIQLIPGYRGYLDLATGNNYLKWVATEVVYRGEEFRSWHDERGPHITHEIPLERSGGDSEIIGAYCSYQTRLSDYAVPVVINRKQIDAARNTNKYGKVWGEHFAEMAMKTAIRRAAKRWKITPQLGRAIYLDELAERGEPQPLELPEGMTVETRKVRTLSEIPDESVEDAETEPAQEPYRSTSFLAFRKAINDTPNDDEESIQGFYPEILAAEQDGSLTADEATQLREELKQMGTMFA